MYQIVCIRYVLTVTHKGHMSPDYEQKYLPLDFSVPPRRRPDPGPVDPLADNLGQDQGEVWQGIRGQWEGHGGVQQGGRRPQPLQGRCGEAEDELEHQEAANGRQQERVRQPVAENQRASGESQMINILKILICPPSLPGCDQRQIGDTTPLVPSPGPHNLTLPGFIIYYVSRLWDYNLTAIDWEWET